MDKPIYFFKGFRFLLVLVTIFSNPILANEKLINVKIGLLESLSPKIPSSSDRYKSLNESALFYALGENEKKLNECGYRITTTTSYFDTLDAIELIVEAKALEQSNPWVIIGPRRSNHFITASKEIKQTPMISTLANADAIFNSNRLIFSMSSSITNLAKAMSNEIEKSNFGKRYGTVVDVRCNNCVDFAKALRKFNSNRNEAFYLEVADNTPDLDKLKENIAKHKIDYLVVPNYSELSGYIISEIQKSNPSIKFVGADGWGENSFSYINGYGVNSDTVAMSIKAGVRNSDKDKYFKINSLDSEVNGANIKPPYSVYALIELIRILSNDLCNSSAKNKHEFSEYLAKKPSNHFVKNVPYSIYKIKNGQLEFSHYVSSNEQK